MAKAIIKYSELIEDDGGFQQARKDFEDLGKDLVQSAKKLQGGLGSINPNSSDGVEKYREEVSQLQAELKKLKTAQSILNKTEQEYNLHQEKKIHLNQSNSRTLVDLDKQITNLKKDLSALAKLEKDGAKLTRDQIAERVKLKIEIKETTSQYKNLEKEVISNSKADKKTIQLMKAKEVLQKENIKTIDEMQERMKALRVVVKSTDTTTEQGKETIKELNAEIDELSDTLNENSDSWIQNKNNIGNYKNDILEAMEGSSLFSTEIGVLNVAMAKLVGALKGNTEATKRNTMATIKNSKAVKKLTKVFAPLTLQMKKVSSGLRSMHTSLIANSKAYRGLTKAVKGAGKGMKLFNNIAKATVILAIVSALLALVQMFKQGRDGAIRMAVATKRIEQAMAILKNTISELPKIFKETFTGLLPKIIKNFQLWAKKVFAEVKKDVIESFSGIKLKIGKWDINLGEGLDESVADAKVKLKEAEKELNDFNLEGGIFGRLGEIGSTIGEAWDNAGRGMDNYVKALKNKFIKEDEILANEFKILDLQGKIEQLEILGGDDTRSMKEMVGYLEQAQELRKQQFNLETSNSRKRLVSIANQNKADIEMTKHKVKVAKDDALREKKSLLQLSNRTLEQNKQLENLRKRIKGLDEVNNKISGISGIEINENNVEDYSNRVRAMMQELSANASGDLTDIGNPFSDEFFKEMSDGQKEVIEKTNQFNAHLEKLNVERRKVQRDIFEQNLDFLIDGFDKTIQRYEQIINNPNLSIEHRMEQNEKFIKEFTKTSKSEIGEFNKIFKQLAEEDDFVPNMDIKFNEDGSYQVFLDGVKVGLEDLEGLNKEIQERGIGEIPLQRMKEVFQQQEDFARGQIDINTQFTEDIIKRSEDLANIEVEKELNKQLQLVSDKAKELKKEFDSVGTSTERKEAIIKEFEEIEEKKTKLEEEAEKQRTRNKIKALKEGLSKLADKDSVVGVEIQLQINELENSLIEDTDAPTLETDADIDTSKLEDKLERLSSTINQVLDKVVDVHKERLKMAEEQVAKQDEMVSKQEKRAREGLTNNLKFEKEQLAKREKEKIEAEKRLRKAEMVKSLYASYTANSKNEKNQGDALVQTIKDFAILRTIEASFGDGGLIADKVPTDGKGIIRGRSHRGQNGGIPVLVEGNEGIFSGSEINNMGRDNFYALKDLAGRGVMPKDMFKRHRTITESHVPMFQDSRIVSELRDVKNAIANQPNQQIDVSQLVNGMVQVSESITTGNKTIRNHHQVKRARL